MKDLVLYTWTIFLAMDQNQVCGVHGITVRGTVPLSLTTMDALILMMWESAVSQVDFGVAIKLGHHFSSFYYSFLFRWTNQAYGRLLRN